MILLSMLFTFFTAGAWAADAPSVHGMAVVGGGDGKIFLSHLPMFHSPHDYQVILEAELSPAAAEAYAEAKQLDPAQTLYTLVPERFSLPDTILGLKPFRAQLFSGHFERNGRPITGEFLVSPVRVVHFRKLSATERAPTTGLYMLFGSGSEQFLAHRISGKPNFDQIVEIEGGQNEAPGTVLSLETGDVPLASGEYMKSHGNAGKVVVKQSLYLEFGDLAH